MNNFQVRCSIIDDIHILLHEEYDVVKYNSNSIKIIGLFITEELSNKIYDIPKKYYIFIFEYKHIQYHDHVIIKYELLNYISQLDDLSISNILCNSTKNIIGNLFMTCKKFYHFNTDQIFWINMFNSKYPNYINKSNKKFDYKTLFLYLEEYIQHSIEGHVPYHIKNAPTLSYYAYINDLIKNEYIILQNLCKSEYIDDRNLDKLVRMKEFGIKRSFDLLNNKSIKNKYFVLDNGMNKILNDNAFTFLFKEFHLLDFVSYMCCNYHEKYLDFLIKILKSVDTIDLYIHPDLIYLAIISRSKIIAEFIQSKCSYNGSSIINLRIKSSWDSSISIITNFNIDDFKYLLDEFCTAFDCNELHYFSDILVLVKNNNNDIIEEVISRLPDKIDNSIEYLSNMKERILQNSSDKEYSFTELVRKYQTCMK